MNLYLTKDNQKLGPYSLEQLRVFLEQGMVMPSDLVWADGWPSWMLISQVPGLTTEQQSTSQAPVVPSRPVRNRKPLVLEFVVAILAFVFVFGGSLFIPTVILGFLGLHPTWSVFYIGPCCFLYGVSMFVLAPTVFDIIPYLRKTLTISRAPTSSFNSLPDSQSFGSVERPKVPIVSLTVVGVSLFIGVVSVGVVSIVIGAPTPKAAIIAVLNEHYRLDTEYTAQHANTGFQSNEAIDRYAQITANLATSLRTIDISKCPQDFQTIYNKDRSSWSSVAEVLARHPHVNSEDEGVAAGFSRGLVGIAQDQAKWESWVDSYDASIATLHSSSDEVTAAATKYGVKWEDITGQ